MSRLTRIVLGGLAIVALLCPSARAAEGGDPILAHLEAVSARVQTLSSDFTQQKYLAVFKEALVSRGRFYYRKPDRLRWELTAPVVSGFALNGQTGRRWQGSERSSRCFELDRDPVMKIVAEQLLAWARADFPWLRAHYRIRVVGSKPVRLRLEPLFATGGFLDHLEIRFAPDGSHVQQVELHEKDGDYTRIRFSDTVVNGPLADGLF